MKNFKNIVANKLILGGKPIIKGTRISVELILEWLGSGGTVDAIIEKYPHISREAINEALLYASEALKNEIVIEIDSAA
jgi:uncharacterized protein (DUF433 family)